MGNEFTRQPNGAFSGAPDRAPANLSGRGAAVLLALILSAFLPGAAAANQNYTIQVLDTLATGTGANGAANLAYGLNENGTIVGQSYNSATGVKEAVIWDSNGNIQSLGFQGLARAVNNSGVVVGETGNTLLGAPNGYAFSWQTGVTTNLGTLGGDYSGAYDINDAGVITGFANIDPNGYVPAVHRTHAFRYSGGTMVDLGTTFDPDGYSRGHGINDADVVVGRGSTWRFENSQKHEAIWDASGQIYMNNPFVGGTYSTGQQINNFNLAVGNAYDASGTERAAVWDNNVFHFMDDLGGGSGRAWSVNDDGVIVGNSFDGAFTKMASVSFDSQTVLALSSLVINMGGWSVLTDAYDVNEIGQIVGYGLYNGEERAFLLTPVTAVPVPAAAWLFGSALGLLGWLRRRRA